MTLTLDVNQQRFVDLAVSGSVPVVMETVAGSGKSTSLAYAYRAMIKSGRFRPQDVLLACLNRHNSDDMKTKLPGAWVMTYDGLAWRSVAHSLGIQTDRKQNLWVPDSKKYATLAEIFAKQYYEDTAFTAEQWQNIEATESLLLFMMNTVTDYTNWQALTDMVETYGLEMPDVDFAQQALPQLLQWGFYGLSKVHRGSMYSVRERYAFEELRWLCAHPTGGGFAKINVRPYPRVLTDERQDANEAHRVLLNRATKGVQLSVGDTGQMIYNFLGSDLYGWEKLLAVPGTIVVDSPITYRCPRAVVKVAQQYVPRLRAWKGAKEGAVNYVRNGEMVSKLKAGHVFVTKTNAQAISVALRCISEGKPAFVKGRAIGVLMTALLDKLAAQKDFTFATLSPCLESWRNSQVHLCTVRLQHPDRAIGEIMDRVNSLLAIYKAAWKDGVDNVATFRVYIDRLFSEELRPDHIIFTSTIWKYKGFENPVVWMFESDLGLGEAVGTSWQERQSRNAAYVGVTRAMDTLNLVRTSGGYQQHLYEEEF